MLRNAIAEVAHELGRHNPLAGPGDEVICCSSRTGRPRISGRCGARKLLTCSRTNLHMPGRSDGEKSLEAARFRGPVLDMHEDPTSQRRQWAHLETAVRLPAVEYTCSPSGLSLRARKFVTLPRGRRGTRPMRMYPAVIHDGTSSNAERKVFELLDATDLGPSSYALHSLHLARHDEKRMAEADFVVVSPTGVLVIEVKGGGVSRNGAVWSYRDRWGTDHRSSEGPFHQAKSAMWSLKQSLEQRDPKKAGDLVWGYAVITPDTNLRASLEWPEETMIGHSATSGRPDLLKPLTAVLKHWQTVSSTSRTRAIDPQTARWMRQQMQPDFDRVPLLSALAEQVERRTATLTEGQLLALDYFSDFDRLLVTGGAGSGKTFLAVESARRARTHGTVAMVVHSTAFARWLRPRLDGIDVLTADALGKPGPSYETLVVDEAQDLMNLDDLDRLDARLDRGLQDGRWRVFGDITNQVGVTGQFERDAWELLQAYAPPAIPLTRNCRNTTNVVDVIRQATGADLGVADAGSGPRVEWVKGDDEQAVAAALSERLDTLMDEEVPTSDIAILSFLDDPGLGVVGRLQSLRNFPISPLDPSSLGHYGTPVTAASIQDFKGLESSFVHLVDVPESFDDRALAHMYVGMSRARGQLWIGCTQASHGEVGKLMNKNLTEAQA